MKTISIWLKETQGHLEKAGVGTARLDALVLLEDVTGKDRTHLLAHPELELSTAQQAELQKLVNRRAKHEPLAYIRSKTEFYGREFAITKDVLEPRPESEMIIDLLKSHCVKGRPLRIIDVGTGSGALAITAKLELSESDVFAVDIDPKCLAVARENADKHGVKIDHIEGDLLEPYIKKDLAGPVIILANLPYVPDDHKLNEAAMNEPKHAIFGGPDGLDLYRIMFEQLGTWRTRPLFVLTESLPTQHARLEDIARAQNFTQKTEQDFIQIFEPN